jgi:hypothetical protein
MAREWHAAEDYDGSDPAPASSSVVSRHQGTGGQVAVRASKREKDAIRAYVENQAHEEVIHLEKAASELVGPVRHHIWDVHCPESRWWVVTNPTNLYSQQDFKSRDVVLTFHLGLALRLQYAQEREVPVAPGQAELLPGSWRRWQQAFETYESGDEAETFQAVGVRLRECLVSFLGETTNDELVPEGTQQPKRADFRAWTELLANTLAAGESATKLRSYPKEDRDRDLGVCQLADACQERRADGCRDWAEGRGASARHVHGGAAAAGPDEPAVRGVQLVRAGRWRVSALWMGRPVL